MPATMKQIEAVIEEFAPLRWACDWDASGFAINLGNRTDNILVCVDVSDEIVEEAEAKNCGLIVSHHPLFFKGLRSIDASTREGRLAARLIGGGISLYCSHTSMDSAPEGINMYLAKRLGMQNRRFLEPVAKKKYNQIGVYVPEGHVDAVAAAMGNAGAGLLGNYRDCVFMTGGEGRFRPLTGANPFIGQVGDLEVVDEIKIEAICAAERTDEAVAQMKAAHPYEEVAYYVTELQNSRDVLAGLGVLGEFEEEITLGDAAEMVKEELPTDHVRVSGDLRQRIRLAGVCGGSAGDLIPLAEKMGAQLFITGEVKHSAYVASGGMALIEAGHYDTEKCFVLLMSQGLQKRLDALQYNVSIFLTEAERRPYSNF